MDNKCYIRFNSLMKTLRTFHYDLSKTYASHARKNIKIFYFYNFIDS